MKDLRRVLTEEQKANWVKLERSAEAQQPAGAAEGV